MKITKRQLRQIVVKAINEGRDNQLATLYSPPGDGSLDTLTTDQVKFEYGMYTGRKFKDVPYYISIDSEQELGEIQRSGDPYTYTTAGSGKMKVVSGPAKDTLAARKWMGALVQNPEDKTSSDKVQQPITNILDMSLEEYADSYISGNNKTIFNNWNLFAKHRQKTLRIFFTNIVNIVNKYIKDYETRAMMVRTGKTTAGGAQIPASVVHMILNNDEPSISDQVRKTLKTKELDAEIARMQNS